MWQARCYSAFPLAAYLDIAGVPAMAELSVFAAAVIGAGIGFLWYNTYPAQVFMGDVGSLSLGAASVMLALLTKNELLSIILGGVFVVEGASVITQGHLVQIVQEARLC